MKPIRLNALAKILSLETSSQALVKGVSIDSRLVKEGDLFFALPGKRVDGHNFISEAVSKGAVAVVVSESYQGNVPVPMLPVSDVLDAFQNLANRWLKQTPLKVVAITGTLGKTTTKEFVTTLLKRTFRVASSPRSYNSQATLPLSILSANGDEDILVLEMAMTHPGQIEKLVSIAPPDVAVLTNVAVQHACNFSDGLAGICREKAAIFSHPKTKLGIVHRDAMHFEEIVQTGNCPKISFSLVVRDAEYFLEAQNNKVTIFPKRENPIEISLNLPLRAHFHNFLAAVVVARHFQISWEAICIAAKDLKLPPMRFEKVEKKGIVFINDAYNANPDSMKAALESLPKPIKGGKTIAIHSEKCLIEL